MSQTTTITQTQTVALDKLQAGPGYVYINAMGGAQPGVSFMKRDDLGEAHVMLHFSRVHFLPGARAEGANGINTTPTNCALASLEVEVDTAVELYTLLGGLLRTAGKLPE